MTARPSPFEPTSRRTPTPSPEGRGGLGVRTRSHRHYAVAGMVLRTELDFPGLPESAATPVGWSLRIGDGPPPPVTVTPIGERTLGPETYRLGWIPSGYRLEYSHAGWFDIALEDSTVTWYRNGGDVSLELVRAIVLGPVMALALERRGLLCLHGSCVVMGRAAVAFLGGKHHGKSTLALALVRAGARWVTDDLIAIAPGSPGHPAQVHPGIASARVWQDAAAQLDIAGLGARLSPGIKSTVGDFNPASVWTGQAPLAAVYVLDPQPAGTAVACARAELRGAHALVALAHQTKLPDALIGPRAAAGHLRMAGEVAASTRLWTLQVVRDFSRLPEVLEQLKQWHP